VPSFGLLYDCRDDRREAARFRFAADYRPGAGGGRLGFPAASALAFLTRTAAAALYVRRGTRVPANLGNLDCTLDRLDEHSDTASAACALTCFVAFTRAREAQTEPQLPPLRSAATAPARGTGRSPTRWPKPQHGKNSRMERPPGPGGFLFGELRSAPAAMALEDGPRVTAKCLG
jgi:hypothetical protein